MLELLLLELLPLGVSKGSTLRALAARPEFEGRLLAAIGDYNNDVELLCAADVSAAPSSALPAVRAAADYVVCSNNDGAVADFIENIFPRL